MNYVCGSNAASNHVAVRNPFNGQLGGSISYNQLTANHGSNYQPEDVWELIKVGFGALSNVGVGVHTPPESGQRNE